MDPQGDNKEGVASSWSKTDSNSDQAPELNCTTLPELRAPKSQNRSKQIAVTRNEQL